jgi:hypothetical protein
VIATAKLIVRAKDQSLVWQITGKRVRSRIGKPKNYTIRRDKTIGGTMCI